MIKELKGKVRAPRLVLDDQVTFSYAQLGGCQFAINGNEDDAFHLEYTSVEGVYDADMHPLWKNHNFLEHQPARPNGNYRGLQIALTDQVVYEGANMGGHHFSFLRDGKYMGHDHRQDNALDFSYGLVKAIFDKDGKPLWENNNISRGN